MSLLSRFFGKERIVHTKNESDLVCLSHEDEKMCWAIEKAGLTLWYFENSLKSPLPLQEYFSIKVKIKDKEHVEHIWLTEPDFDDEGNLFGLVGNEPIHVTTIRMGQRIGVERNLISDWMIVERGRLIGGYTLRAIRELLPETEKKAFDESLGLRIDNGADYFKPDFNTPEGAILCLEKAYEENDLNKALFCKDFYQEARLMLSKMNFPIEEEMIRDTAELLELSFVDGLKRDGMPDFSNTRRAFISREKVNENYWIITEVCIYPDGGSSEQRLNTYKTALGWRVLGVSA